MTGTIHAILLVALASTASTVAADDWRHKVDAWVLRNADTHRVELLVMLDAQADVSGAAQLRTKAERGAHVYARVSEVAARTQPPVLAVIEAAGATYRAFKVANAILVEGDLERVRALAARADVRRIHANPRVALREPLRGPERAGIAAIEPNIIQTQAPAEYWAAGFTGQGIVVANQDTGVQ